MGEAPESRRRRVTQVGKKRERKKRSKEMPASSVVVVDERERELLKERLTHRRVSCRSARSRSPYLCHPIFLVLVVGSRIRALLDIQRGGCRILHR